MEVNPVALSEKETSSQSQVTAPPQHAISDSDMDLIYATDSVDDAIARIRAKAIEPFSLRVVRRLRHHVPWLGERGLSPKRV